MMFRNQPATWKYGLVVVFGLVGTSFATPITFSAAQGNLAASATFETIGSRIRVTLTNTSQFDVLRPEDVLTAVFFTVEHAPALTPVSAILGIGSSVVFGVSDPGGVVGGEWAYGSGLVGAPHGARQGISSSGFGLFGSANFPGTNLQGPIAVDGIQYGILSAGDNPATGNAAVTGLNAFIKNAVVFELSCLRDKDKCDSSLKLKDVSFQYGTSLSDPNIPEPAPLGLLSMLGVALLRRTKRA